MPNKQPKANNLKIPGVEDQLTPIVLFGSDLDGSITGYTLTSLPSNGTLYLDPGQTQLAQINVTYTSNTLYFLPKANFSGDSSFNYTVRDNQNAISPSAAFTISVAAVNDAPGLDLNGAASGSSTTLNYVSVGSKALIAPSANVTDIDSANFGSGTLRVSITQSTTADQLSITTDSTLTIANGSVFVSSAKIGSIIQNGSNGSDLLINLANGATPAAVSILIEHVAYSNSSANASTPPRTVTFSVVDGDGIANGGADTSTATATINFAPPPPVDDGDATVTISGSAQEDSVLTANFANNDPDGAATVGPSYQWYRDGGAIGGATGSTYTLGDADVSHAITVRVSYTDGQGFAETIASAATAVVANVNDAPTGSVTISGTATEDQVLTASNTLADADGLGTITYHWLRGGVDTGATGTTYTLGDPDVGAQISVRATYTDGRGTAEAVTSAATTAVANVNDAPTGSVTISGTATEDQVLTASNTLADAEGLGTITYHWLRGGVDTGATGTTYTLGDPDVGAQISVRATYTDGRGTAEAVTSAATTAVANVNDAPTLANAISNQAATEGSAFSFTLPTNTFNDVDVGDTLTLSATLADDTALPGWLHFDTATATFSGTPLNDDVETLSVKVTARDGSNASVSDVFDIVVANTNDPPVAVQDHAVTDEETVLTGNVLVDNQLGADFDPDGDTLTVVAINGVAADVGQSVTLPSGATVVVEGNGSFTFDPRGAFDFVPANAGSADSFTYTISDGHGGSSSALAVLSVSGVNDAPTLANAISNQAATEDSAFSFTLPTNTFNDVDVGDTLTLSATLADDTALPGWLHFDTATATFSGTPLNDDVETLSVKVTARDGSNASVSDVFDIVVANTNDPPVAVQDHAVTDEETVLTGNVLVDNQLGADFDPDGDTLTVVAINGVAADVGQSVTLPSGATVVVEGNGSFTFDPRGAFDFVPANAGSADSFTYTISDGHGGSSSALAVLSVSGVNDAPTLANAISNQAATEDSAFSFTLPTNTFNDVDVGDTLTLSATLADDTALPGWLHFDTATATFSGTPLNQDVGTIHVKVTATDSSAASISDTFDLAVANTNDAPSVTGSIAVQPIRVNDAFSLTIPANLFTDIDVGDQLTITAGTPNGGALPSWLSYDSNIGIISGTPSATDAGLVQLTLTATDIAGASASILVPVVVVDQQAIVGTPNDDNLTGTVGGDTIYGLEGNDTLDGSAGADYVDGGLGNDILYGRNGADLLVGGDGDDQLYDGSSNDVLQGGAGNDYLNLSYSGAAQSLTQVADDGEGNNSFGVSNATNPLISYQLTAGSGNDNFSVSGVGHFTIDAGSGENNLYLYNSNSNYPKLASGTFSSGGDNDQIYMEGLLGSWTVDLGAGNDNITIYSYGNPTAGSYNFTIHAGDGNDSIQASGLGSYNSLTPFAVIIDGGAGDDVIYAPNGYNQYTQITITGGDGSDTIYYAGTSQATIDAGDGNDVIRLTANQPTTLTLGSGSDQIIVEGWSGSSSAAATIADFATGAGGDRINLSAIWDTKLVGWDGSANPFGAGFAHLVQDGDDSLLQIDVDGAGNASSYQTLLRIQNHTTSDFTIDNFNPPYPTDGSLPAGQTISGTPNDDNLTGTVGGDTIYGLEGNDTLDGSAGADYVDGGLGNDILYGRNGADLLVGGDGDDQLYDGSSNDVLQGGAGNDYLNLSYSGAAQSLTQVADDGEGNNSFGVSNATNPLISYQLTAGSGNDNFSVSGVGHFTIDAGSGENNLYLYNSNSNYPKLASGTFSSGGDNDQIYMEGLLGSWTVDSGAGNDNITIYSYGNPTAGSYNFTIHAGDGNDSIQASGLGSYNSLTPFAVIIDGGAGDDVIYAPNGYNQYTQITITGGDGSDTIYYAGTSQATIDAGDGNDVIRLTANQPTTLTLGSGSDQIIVEGWSGSSSAAATIADFATGAGGDRINLSAIWDTKLVGWDGSANPFGAGFAHLVQDGDDSLLQIDVDGAGNASSYQTLLRIQNHTTSDFTIDNFNPPYPTDGSLPAGQTISGTPNDDNLTGTVGGDTIYGLEGNDTLDGSAGADYVDGGLGNDILYGRNGADLLVGGDGDDQLYDGSSNDVLQGGAGNDYLNLSYSGAAQSLTQVADDGEGNNSFGVSNATNPLISYQLTAGSGNDNFSVSGVGHFTIDAGSGENNLYLYNSNSNYPKLASGTFSSGGDNDQIYMEGLLGSWTVDSGAGNDNITIYSYGNPTAGSYNFTIHAGDGNDSIQASGLGSYNSLTPFAVIIDGGAGDDVIYAPNGYNQYTQITITGGDGSDTIYYAGTSQATIDAGDGNDVIRLTANQPTTLTLGSGSDQIIVEGWSGSSSAAATIADFATGAGGDRINLSAIWDTKLVGWDGSANPFGAGFAHLVQDGDDSLLQIDVDGAGNASSYQTLLRIQNHTTSDFTIDNFNPPYPTDGSGIAGQNLAGSGTIIGTIGDDTITGSSGVDILNGGSGADHLIGGAGPDTLTGGFGADTFVFNDPSDGLDIITDFVSGANTPAGDHLEISTSGFGGGLTAGGAAPLVTAADAASASNQGSDGYFIFDNVGPNAGTVYWDSTGGSGTDAAALVVLTGVNSLQASDFHLV